MDARMARLALLMACLTACLLTVIAAGEGAFDTPGMLALWTESGQLTVTFPDGEKQETSLSGLSVF